MPSAPDDRLGTQLAHIVAEIRIYQGFEEVLLMGKSVTSWFESRYHGGFTQR